MRPVAPCVKFMPQYTVNNLYLIRLVPFAFEPNALAVCNAAPKNWRKFSEVTCVTPSISSSFYQVALRIDVHPSNGANRDIHAIPGVAEFSVPG